MKRAILTSRLLASTTAVVSAVLLWQAAPTAHAGGGPLCGSPETVRAILSENPEVAKTSIATLRAFGQPGMEAIFAVHHAGIAALSEAYLQGKLLTPEQQRLGAALDAVAQQHNAFTSRLFWYTDLDAAKSMASATGKPILSLRLLGKLTDEYSCANSRFFRTILYANEAVSKQLRENYVLHWESVRPVPKVTIDFGDGRTLERTLTGNSIHYVLDAEGRVIDGIPGLVGPGAFMAGIEAARETEKALQGKPEEARTAALLQYHQERLAKTLNRWAGELQAHGARVTPLDLIGASLGELVARQSALAAMTDDAQWRNLAAQRLDESKLDVASWRLIAAQHRTTAGLPARQLAQGAPAHQGKAVRAEAAARMAIGKSIVEDPLLRLTRATEKAITADTARNEYLLHTQLHAWFAGGTAPAELAELNERVYAELFLTPSSDPWLGLAPADAYSALERDGRSEPLIGSAKQP